MTLRLKLFLLFNMLFLMTWADGTAQNISIGQNITQQTEAQTGKVCRPKVALALSGGGAKAAATIGALKYIEKAGIPIDYIVGTSSGAVVGSLYAYGYRAAEIEKIYYELDWKEIFSELAPLRRKSPRPDRYVPGMLSGEDLTYALDSLFGHYDGQFDSLPIPFRAMAVDAAELNEVCMDSGNLAQAVRASISVPIAFRPVEKEKMVLVDGGILNNLPVDVAYRMGADIVIAIDLMKDCRATQHGRDSISSRGLGAILVWKFARPDLKKYQENRKRASLLIHPDISGYSSTSFDPEETDSLVQRGEMEGQKVWTELQEIAKLCHNEGHDKGQKNNLGK